MISSFAPDISKAKLSALRINSILKRQPAIDSFKTDENSADSIYGHIIFKNVSFNYPMR